MCFGLVCVQKTRALAEPGSPTVMMASPPQPPLAQSSAPHTHPNPPNPPIQEEIKAKTKTMPPPARLRSSSLLFLLLLGLAVNLLLLLQPPPTAHAFRLLHPFRAAAPSHRTRTLLPPLHAKGFGFGKKSNPTQEEAEEKHWNGIYSPYPARRPIDPIDETPCACGSGQSYARCCFPLHTGETKARTPEAVLRSRYTAYYHG